MKLTDLNAKALLNATAEPARMIAERNRVLLDGAVRAGSPRYDCDRGLILYHAPPRYDGGHVAQESLDYAVALAETSEQTDRVPRIVEATLRAQDTDRASISFGNFRWMDNWARALDPNAVSFMVPCYYRLLHRHHALLGDSLASRLRDALSLAGQALLAHRAQWAYGNIFLLNILAKLQIADLLDDPRLRQIALWDFEEWIAHTSLFGITEFNSPVYSAVQIFALEGVLDLPLGPEVHQRVRAALTLYYTEAFLYYHAPSGQFAGAKSRHAPAYRGRRRLPLHALLYRQTGDPEPQDDISHAGYALSTYSVGQEFRRLAAGKKWPVCIDQTSPYHGLTRRTWMTPRFALSSMSGGRYGHDDVPVEVLASDGDAVCQVLLEGQPHQFDIFTSQQGGLLVGAVRWRFCPPELDASETQEFPLPFRVGYASQYVPADIGQVLLRLRFLVSPQDASVYIGRTKWDGQTLNVVTNNLLNVRIGGVTIGYRGPGPQVLTATGQGFCVEAALASPDEPPWRDVQPFLLCVAEEEQERAGETRSLVLHDAEVRQQNIPGGVRIEGRMAGKVLTVDVPDTPTTLLKGGRTLVAGRLAEAVRTDRPAEVIWEEQINTD